MSDSASSCSKKIPIGTIHECLWYLIDEDRASYRRKGYLLHRPEGSTEDDDE